MGSPNDEPFVGCESRLDKLSSHVPHAPRNFVDWYNFSWEVEPIFYPGKTADLLFLSDWSDDEKTWSVFITRVRFYQTVTDDENLGLGPDRLYLPPLHVCT